MIIDALMYGDTPSAITVACEKAPPVNASKRLKRSRPPPCKNAFIASALRNGTGI